MTCPRCQQSNPLEARYCLGCGSRLAFTCGSCGTELPAGARFCLQCGHAVAPGASAPARSPSPETYTPRHLAARILTSRSVLAGERKQVTVPWNLFVLGVLAAGGNRANSEIARDHLRRALALGEGGGMRPLVARIHMALGELARQAGKDEEANTHLGVAATMFREMGIGGGS